MKLLLNHCDTKAFRLHALESTVSLHDFFPCASRLTVFSYTTLALQQLCLSRR